MKSLVCLFIFFLCLGFTSLRSAPTLSFSASIDTVTTQTDTLTIPENRAAPQQNTTLNEIRALRSEIGALQELLEGKSGDTETALRRLNDRMGALDQRLISIENRTNQIYTDIRGVDQSFATGIGFMVAIALLTIGAIFIYRIKFIDPMHVQLARFEAELARSDSGKSEQLRKTLNDLAENDPKLKQLLHKYGMDQTPGETEKS